MHNARHLTFLTGVLATCLTSAAQKHAEAAASKANDHAVIDCEKIARKAPTLPDGLTNVRYGLLVFGAKGDVRMWAVTAGGEEGKAPHTLYLDLDADGDLTEAGERFDGKGARSGGTEFVLAKLATKGSKQAHTDVKITWTKDSTRLRMLWRGEKVTFGGFGPTRDTYGKFAESPAAAPVYVPGYDRPFAFDRWIEDPIQRDTDTDFKVFVGNRGDRTGTFFAVDDKFLPEGEFAVAVLSYKTRKGKDATARFELRQRC